MGIVGNFWKLLGKVIPKFILRTLLSIPKRKSEEMVLAKRKGISLGGFLHVLY
jgi:hypothetical protein